MPGKSKSAVRNQEPSLDPAGSAAESRTAVAREQRELLVIEAGGQLFGVFTEEVGGIATGKTPAPLPRAPVSVLGVIAFRGRMLTVIDPLPLLGKAAQLNAAIFVALSGEEQLALAADSSRGAIEIFSGDIEVPQPGAGPEIIYGIITREGKQINILDVPGLFGATMQHHERRRRRF